MVNLLVGALVALAVAATTPGAAQAAAPANDDSATATLIGSLPFSDAIDTTEATQTADDPTCSGAGPTVWYAFHPLAFHTTEVEMVADTFGSNYDTTLSVWVQGPNGWSQVACNDDSGGAQSRVAFIAYPGVDTYYFMVGTYASGPGGALQFHVDAVGDTTPPVLNLPAPITADATDGEGAVVGYFAWAWDDTDGFLNADCAPAPWTKFPLGVTTVECAATDSSGNVAHASFTVTVRPPLVIQLAITGGSVDPVSGIATVRGTIECSRGGALPSEPTQASFFGNITQRVGRTLVKAMFSDVVECSTPAVAWRARTFNATGLFVAGNAGVIGWAGAAGYSTSTEATIRLKAER